MFQGKRYPAALRAKAISAVQDRKRATPADRTIYREVAQQFNVGEQSLRLWVKKLSAPQKPSKTSAPPDEIESLRREVERLRAENAVLKRAFVVFSADWAHADESTDDPSGGTPQTDA